MITTMTPDPLPPTPPKRKRGAQPGNHNSLKHGFYTHTLDTRLYPGLQMKGVLPADTDFPTEITFLRASLIQVFAQTRLGTTDRLVWLQALSSLALASSRLAYLLSGRSRKIKPGPEVAVELSRAILSTLGEGDHPIDWQWVLGEKEIPISLN